MLANFGCSSSRRSRRRPLLVAAPAGAGFTLIELLVVIAIIAVLMAMILPAVQQVRETVRKAECRNHLMQIGLALHNYEMAFELLPPGVLNSVGPIKSLPEGYHVGWLLQLLPYIDQNTVYGRFDLAAGVYDNRQDLVRGVPLPAFYCPSTLGEALQLSADQKYVGVACYAGCSHHVEAPIDAANSGVLFLNSHVRYEEITDGAANTLFVGEKPREDGDLGWASGTRASLRNATGVNQLLQRNSGQQRPAAGPAPIDPLTVGGFGSHHSGGAHFLMGDGSVRFLSEYIDQVTFSNLGNRADGQLPGNF